VAESPGVWNNKDLPPVRPWVSGLRVSCGGRRIGGNTPCGEQPGTQGRNAPLGVVVPSNTIAAAEGGTAGRPDSIIRLFVT